MKRLRDILISILISPEMAVIAILVILCSLLHEPIENMVSFIRPAESAVNWLTLAPAALLVLTLKERKELLSPESNSTKEYLNWPNYQMVKDRFFITLAWEFFALCVTLIIWVLGLSTMKFSVVIVFFGAILISVVSYVTFLIATVTLKEILK